MTLTYETVDVFTETPFGGNPLAVVFGGEDLSTERMQAIAVERIDQRFKNMRLPDDFGKLSRSPLACEHLITHELRPFMVSSCN